MRKVLKITVLLATLAAASSAHATNGYFLPGFGMKATGMGGVGIAAPQDSTSAAANPANLIKVGMRGDIGASIFNPVRSARVGAASELGPASPFNFDGGAKSDKEWFVIPEMAMAMPLTDTLHAGIAFVGNGGMNTTYRAQNGGNFFAGAAPLGTLGVDLNQLLIPISVGYKVSDDHALGASLVGAVQRFEALGLDNFANVSSNPNFLTNKGFDWSYGAGVRFGWLGDFLEDRVSIGVTWASKTYMTKFDKYKGLFAEQGDFDIPSNYGLGISIKATKDLTFAADVTRILYEDVASVANRGPGVPLGVPGIPAGFNVCNSAVDPRRQFCLGNDLGMGFGWKNMTVYKFGVDWMANENWTWRAGFNYGKTPIPDDQLTFNTLAPAVVEKHYSVGFTWKKPDSPMEITGAYMYVDGNKQSAANQNIVGGVDIMMHQHVLGVSLGWVLDQGAGLH